MNLVNLLTPRPEGRGLLKVHPQLRPFTPSLKGGASRGRTGEGENLQKALKDEVKNLHLGQIQTFSQSLVF
jgi:hypothetical protein